MLSSFRFRALCGYLAAAVVFTWPLVVHPFAVLGSVQGPGDTYLNLWVLGWDLRAIATHPSTVLTGRVFDAPIFHPATGTLAYSDHLLLQAAALTPAYLLTHNLAFCYNLLLFASLVLSAAAMYACARELGADRLPAWVAGLAFGFAPYHFSHLIHLQLQALYLLPLCFLYLHRTTRGLRRRDAAMLGLILAAQAMSSVYYGVIGAAGLAVAAAVSLLSSRSLAVVRRLLFAAAVGVVVVAPVAWKYLSVHQSEGGARSLYEASQGAAAVRSYFEVPPSNLLYGATGLLPSHAPDDRVHKATEQNLFPGFALIGLALIGIGSARERQGRIVVASLAAVAAAGFVLSLGPDGFRPLYSALYSAVFGFQAIRAPARFSVLTLFGLAGLAAFGAGAIKRWQPARASLLLAAIVGVLMLEYANVPFQFVAAPRLETPAGTWLRDARESGAVVYLPLDMDPAFNTTVMVEALTHGRPILNGYSGLTPSFFPALVDVMEGFPSVESIRALLDLNVPFVVTREPVATGDFPIVEKARFGDAFIYMVHESPDLDSRLVRPELPALPAPESIPFQIGERSTYSVVWTSGPLRVSAGDVVMSVGAGTDGAQYAFEARGTTAAWVSRFFQADDRFISRTDARFFPLTFEQHLKEGRRQVDRVASFDRARRVVRLRQGSGPEIALAIHDETLDPLALFFYLRTLSLTSGTRIRVAINDSRRNYEVEVRVGGMEAIETPNGPIQALRLDPEIRRSGGPTALRLAVWLSTGSSRIPLAAEVSGLAGVGTVRLQLEAVR